MKKVVIFVVLVALAYSYARDQGVTAPWSRPAGGSYAALEVAFANRQSGVQVKGDGSVVKTLKDDLDGSRHQRFIIKLTNGQTVLISHNIDLAPRIEDLREGDSVEFFGEYEWNTKGGVVHWTHHDPAGRHAAGWIRHQGNLYQ